MSIDTLYVHLVRLGGLFQLRQDLTTTSLRRAVHLKHLGQKIKFLILNYNI